MNNICMIGLGYIGLPTAMVAAKAGFSVVGFDVDKQRVERINNGTLIMHEPGFEQRLKAVMQQGNFRATTAIEAADCFVIAVPTPFTADKKADLSYVLAAASTMAPVLKVGDVVILESTVPVGTTHYLSDFLNTKTGMTAGKDFFVAHCPERVLPGNIFYELLHNARIIGGINPVCVEHAKRFYKRFVQGSLYLTDATTAEMVKLVENSSRDVAIAFANQVAAMADAVGLNAFEVIELANKHPRVNILRPGCGVGGHCIAVDPWFLVETFPSQSKLLALAREINDAKPLDVVRRIRSQVDELINSFTVPRLCKMLVLGVTYKPNVDDMRESPALAIAGQLATWQDCDLLVCEPQVDRKDLGRHFNEHQLVTLEQGLEQADLIISLVAHSAFVSSDQLGMSTIPLLDFCGLLHVPRQESTEQERPFWPASSIYAWPESSEENQAVIHHTNQSINREHAP